MKKFLTVLSIVLLLVALYLWYELKQTKDELLSPVTWDSETISQLETKISELQSEIQLLKEALPWDSEVEQSLSWNENNSNLWDNTTNTSNNNSSTSNTTTTNWKEVWRIQQVYTDKNWIKKIEIVYGGSMVGWDECGDPAAAVCFKADNPKVGTFTVSDNVQIIMQTLSHTKDGYFNNDQVITFDYFEQKFNDTNNYDEYPHNYSNHFKLQVYRITIENDIVVKIEEQYMP